MSVEEFNALVFAEIEKANEEKRPCDLSGTIFEGDIAFTGKTFPEISFRGATFSGKANFTHATFSGKTHFLGAKFSGEADFTHATFSANATFGGADLLKIYFRGNTFLAKSTRVNLVALRIEEAAIFQNVNLENAAFYNTDLRRCDFITCKWHEEGGRYILQDETDFREEHNRLLWKSKEERVNRVKDIENLYRTMKLKSKEKNNEFEVSHWHYSEKEMHRERTYFRDEPFNWLALNLYNLSSGYGENPRRAGILLFGVIVCAFILISAAGVVPTEAKEPYIKITNLLNMGITDWDKQFVSTIEHLMFRAPTYFKPATVSSSFLKLVFQIFTPIQATLFAFALRNKFRRT